MDFTRDIDATEWVTAIIPRGARLDEEEIEGLEAYTTAKTSSIVDNWHASGSMVVKNPDAVANYGFICAVVDWDKVTIPDNLVTKAKKYLQNVQFNKMVLEVSAIDLHYMNPDIEGLHILEKIRCISTPHGMDTEFPITKIELDLQNPANTKYTLGTEVYGSLTSISSKVSNDVYNYINDTPSESTVLRSAKANAKALMEGTIDGGYASFIYGTDANGVPITDPATGELTHPERPTGLEVMNAYTNASATNRWLWTFGGFGHQTKAAGATSWSLPNVAITMDGAIVANAITTGTLKLAGNGSAAILQVYNGDTLIGSWKNDGIWVRRGSISLGNPIKFSVTDEGILTAVDGNFSGTITGSTFKTSPQNNKQIYIHDDRIEIYNTSTSGDSGALRFHTGPMNNRTGHYSMEFGMSANGISIAYDDGSSYENTDMMNLFKVAQYYGLHGGWAPQS